MAQADSAANHIHLLVDLSGNYERDGAAPWALLATRHLGSAPGAFCLWDALRAKALLMSSSFFLTPAASHLWLAWPNREGLRSSLRTVVRCHLGPLTHCIQFTDFPPALGGKFMEFMNLDSKRADTQPWPETQHHRAVGYGKFQKRAWPQSCGLQIKPKNIKKEKEREKWEARVQVKHTHTHTQWCHQKLCFKLTGYLSWTFLTMLCNRAKNTVKGTISACHEISLLFGKRVEYLEGPLLTKPGKW